VLRQGNRVKLRGAADRRFIGRRVRIVFSATGRTVARARVRANGTFTTTAALPRRSIRNTNRARYQAVLGKARSLRLKLARRMVVTSVSSRRGRVTITGRVIRPLARPIRQLKLMRRVSCTRSVVVKRFKLAPSGRFRVTARAPKGRTSVYRLTTMVRMNSNPKAFNSYTLPRAVSVR
jgi:hypothetical protein